MCVPALRQVVSFAIVVLLVAAACGPKEVPSSQAVSFNTRDEVTLRGHLYGSGTTGVVLAHMYPSDQTSWSDFAKELANEGYLALTFDFRGYGESGGKKEIDKIDRDVEAAVRAVRERGATRVAVIGASMGGTAALVAAARKDPRTSPDGVAALSAPVSFMGLSVEDKVAEVALSTLFVASEDDSGAATAARWFYDNVRGPKAIMVVPGNAHGTDMLKGERAVQVKSIILNFIQPK